MIFIYHTHSVSGNMKLKINNATIPKPTANQSVATRVSNVAETAASRGTFSAVIRTVISPSVAPRPPGIMTNSPAKVELAKTKTETIICTGYPRPSSASERQRHSKNHETLESRTPASRDPGPERILVEYINVSKIGRNLLT